MQSEELRSSYVRARSLTIRTPVQSRPVGIAVMDAAPERDAMIEAGGRK